MKHTFIVICTILLVTGSSVVFAQDEDTEFSTAEAQIIHWPVTAEEATDNNVDGQISAEEYRNRLTKIFFEIDADADGSLDEEEYDEVLVEPQVPIADGDSDGDISHREFMSHARALFEALDANDDGHLTPEELKAAVGGGEKP